MGIGASAGSLEALDRFFDEMPGDSGMIVVVVQHLERSHRSALAELLGKHTQMPVQQAEDGVRAQPDHVYIIPPNAVLTLERGLLRVARAAETGLRMPIDAFLRSLAQDQGESAVGIVLSGAGTDGTAGLRAIKEGGGLTLAQTPGTAKYDSMPRSAIAAGLVDFALPVEEMPSRLQTYAEGLAEVRRKGNEAIDAEVTASLGAICEILQRHTRHDFSDYKQGTLRRRIRRRIQIQQAASVTDYVRCLEQNAAEVELLHGDLLIGVTHFMRDREAFSALAEQVIPTIMDSESPSAPVRIWVPGCSSGEEAYSIAILVREHSARINSTRHVQIFATDIDGEQLATARRGSYSGEIREHVSLERLERFFTREGEAYQVDKKLRGMCTFSEHSLINDPPFSSLDLISCRNVLIYFAAELQKKLVPLFHYALRPGGYLLLGPSESLAAYHELFVPVDKKYRLFRRNDSTRRPRVEFPLSGRAGPLSRGTLPPLPSTQESLIHPSTLSRALERMIREEYAPPCVVVDERGEILYLTGRTSRYLQAREGVPTNNLLEQAHTSLRLELRTALAAAVKTRQAAVRRNVSVEPTEAGGSVRRLCLTVRPLPGLPSDAGLYAVVLQGSEAAADIEAGVEAHSAPPSEHLFIEQLEDELRTSRADLQASAESLETSNEELTATNEELISTNEELQSANEELQTSKEEMLSANDELRMKVQELDAANSDLQHHYLGTQIATIFVDRELHITRFTPSATKLFNVLEGDVGRPIGDLSPGFVEEDLLPDIQTAMRTETAVERYVHRTDAAFLVRILPYRSVTQNAVVTGVGVTFVDITELVRAREADRNKDQFLAMLSHELRNPLAPIRNSLYILERASPGGEQAKRAHAVIDRQVSHMTRITDDLLDVTRIARGKIQMQRDSVDLRELVLRAVEDHRSTFAANGVELEVAVGEATQVLGDRTRLAQALGNVLSNAAKFTPPHGRTRITLERDKQAAQAIVCVRDTGAGVAADVLPHVFEPFVQADGSLARTRGGLGLGLALVKGLIEMHGGTVTAHSSGLGTGAEFTIRLPLGGGPVAAVPPGSPKLAHASRRVLVIEDNVDAAQTLREALEFGEHKIEVAYNGPEGLLKAHEFKPEVVFCDIGLSQMDGYEVAKAIRADEAVRATYLVALTGYALPADVARAKEAGFDQHMVKPPSMEKLEQVLATAPAAGEGR